MVVSALYVVVCRLLELIVLLGRGNRAKELEILVLRHELSILRRQAGRPRFEVHDRVLLAAFSRILPRHSWTGMRPAAAAPAVTGSSGTSNVQCLKRGGCDHPFAADRPRMECVPAAAGSPVPVSAAPRAARGEPRVNSPPLYPGARFPAALV